MSARVLLKNIGYGAAWRSGALAALRWLQRARIPIVCYHSIVDQPTSPGPEGGGGLHVSVDRFREQLRFLARHYRVVSLEQAVAELANGRPSPTRATVVLTFDDGYANNLSVAAPLLAEYGFPATVFLATDYMGRQLFWWDELRLRFAALAGRKIHVDGWGREALELTEPRRMAEAFSRGDVLLRAATLDERATLLGALASVGGKLDAAAVAAVRPATWDECRRAPGNIRFGGHGASHRLLGEIPLDAIRSELQRCSRALRVELGDRATDLFCYPAGQWTPEVQTELPGAGLRAAVLAGSERSDERLAGRDDDPTLLPRIGVGSAMTLPVFAGNLAGIRSLLGRVRPLTAARAPRGRERAPDMESLPGFARR
jgi:peptidoglycan/xylan/chitin deacetylase (PgdA/CDA1 family)